jgi:hypothetical protein
VIEFPGHSPQVVLERIQGISMARPPVVDHRDALQAPDHRSSDDRFWPTPSCLVEQIALAETRFGSWFGTFRRQCRDFAAFRSVFVHRHPRADRSENQ